MPFYWAKARIGLCEHVASSREKRYLSKLKVLHNSNDPDSAIDPYQLEDGKRQRRRSDLKSEGAVKWKLYISSRCIIIVKNRYTSQDTPNAVRIIPTDPIKSGQRHKYHDHSTLRR